MDEIFVTRPNLPPLEELITHLREIWDNRWLTNNGVKHQTLEKELKKALKVDHLSLFTNGAIALQTAVYALELTGEVITTPFTFPATPHVLTLAGITPVFCDIDPITCNLDPKKIRQAITSKTTAILAVHVYGRPCAVQEIQEIADEHGLKVIYDAAHVFGVDGIGNYGDISMFSFHATKLFSTAEGGCLTFRDPVLKEKCDQLKNFGILNENEVISAGTNGKVDEIRAALGLVNLNYFREEIERRKEVAKLYEKELNGIPGIALPTGLTNYQYYPIRVKEGRDQLHNNLKKQGIYTRKYFYPLCSQYPHYKTLPSSNPANLPHAHEAVQEVLCLPIYGELKEEQVLRICDQVKKHENICCNTLV